MTDTQLTMVADFLLARIVEDEMLASTIDCPCGETSTHPLPHCGARVLADCEVKRQIVEALDLAERNLDEVRRTAPAYQLVSVAEGSYYALLYVVRLLVTPFADHPDFREEWKA